MSSPKKVTLPDGSTMTLAELYRKVRNGEIQAAEDSDGVIMFPNGYTIGIDGKLCAPGVEPKRGHRC